MTKHWQLWSLLGLLTVSTIFSGFVLTRNQYYFGNECHQSCGSRDAPPPTHRLSLGQEIVRTSYRTSGFEDFATVLCPLADNAEILPSRIMDELTDCLRTAHDLGSNHSTIYNQRWPWWFQTLLRDLTETAQQNQFHTGRSHYLQFKNVGIPLKVAGENAPPRLQLCIYEKGGTKSWNKFHCEHNRDEYRENRCYRKQPPFDELMSMGHDQNSIAAHKSEKAVFLRDPLERFLSGFIDKCVSWRSKERHCETTSVFLGENSTIEDMLRDKKRMFQAYVDSFPLTWNIEFFPQSFFCGGLYRTLGDYDFVGSMGNRFYQDLNAMRKRYPGLEPAMEKIYSLSEKLNATNAGVETGAASQVLEYYTPHTVRRVLEYYAIDYVSLGLPIPVWAEELLLRE